MAQYCFECGSVIEDKEYRQPASFGDLSMPATKHELTCGDLTIRLAPQEGLFLADLMNGKPVSNEALLMRWMSEDVDENIVKVYMTRLRQKICMIASTCVIDVIYGFGYQLKSRAVDGKIVEFGDIVFDRERRLLMKNATCVTLRPGVCGVLYQLMTRSFVDFRTVERPAGDWKVDTDQWLRLMIVQIRRALRELTSKVSVMTVAKRWNEGNQPGFYLKVGKIIAVDGPHKGGVHEKAPGRVVPDKMTPRQLTFYRLVRDNPDCSFDELGKLYGKSSRHASQMASLMRGKGFLTRIAGVRKTLRVVPGLDPDERA